MEAVTTAAEELLAAMEAQIGVGKAQDKVKFDQPQGYISTMELKGRLHLMLTAIGCRNRLMLEYIADQEGRDDFVAATSQEEGDGTTKCKQGLTCLISRVLLLH